MDTISPQEVNPQIIEHRSPSFLQRYKFTILALVIILIALIPLILLTKTKKKPTPQPVAQQTSITTTPTVAPLTQQNAQPTLDAIDTKIQSALDQSNTDLQQASQVNTSGDSTTGL